ncbi:hypothetical protein GBAR_LOCUS27602, partial [Geodia barretti]
LTLQSPECGNETISDDIVTCSKQVNFTTPTSSVYERSQSSTYPTPMMSVIQVTPVPSVGISSPINYSSHRNVIRKYYFSECLLIGVCNIRFGKQLELVCLCIFPCSWSFRVSSNSNVGFHHCGNCCLDLS